MSGTYKLATQDVSCENFDGEYVVLNLASGHYFALSRSGSALLEGLLAGFDFGEVSDALGGSEPARRGEIDAFLANLLHHDLVASDIGTVARPLTADWSETARRALDPFVLEAFDDIADLINADPIHDTDESIGWPVIKEA